MSRPEAVAPTQVVRAHGVDGLATDPDWPPLTSAEVGEIVTRVADPDHAARIVWHSPRPLSAAALVQTASTRLFIKRHHVSVRTPATLGEEHRFMQHLRAAGMPVPQVLHDADGQTALRRGDWVFEVHAQLAGTDLYRDLQSWSPLPRCAHARAAGRALARLHVAAAGYRAPQRSTHILVTRDDLLRAADPVAALTAQLCERPGLAGFLRPISWQDALHSVIVPLQQRAQARIARQDRLWTHNDWHASNLAWSGPGADADVTSAFDFGLASPTFALFDLATAIERNAIAWLRLDLGAGAVHTDIALALIQGYRELRALAAADLQLLADLLPVVHVDFALSEVEYFHAITGSPANAKVAWHTFLLGHARWFDSAPGRALLDAIAAA